MLGGLQSRSRCAPHLAEVVAVIPFAGFESVKNETIDSRSNFLSNFHLLLNIFRSHNSLLLQDFQGFQCRVKPAIQSGQSVVNCCFHISVLETYYSRFDLDILRLMFMECPHRSENSLAQGFENYDLKRRCFKAIWRIRL